MAMSPAVRAGWLSGSDGEGKDNTSVGMSLAPNCRFRERIAVLLVNRRLTVPLSFTAFLARSRKARSVGSLSLATRFWKMTTSFLGRFNGPFQQLRN